MPRVMALAQNTAKYSSLNRIPRSATDLMPSVHLFGSFGKQEKSQPKAGTFSSRYLPYLERTAMTSISTNAQGAASAATCIAALAGLFG